MFTLRVWKGRKSLPLLEDFCRRGVFRDKDGEYQPTVELFASWLKEGGFSHLISDQLGDELAEARQQREDAAYVRADEIAQVTEQWGLYQGREIGAEQVRRWLSQVSENVSQRMLFKTVGEHEVRARCGGKREVSRCA